MKERDMKAIWKHKKYPGTYTGSYEREIGGERVFVLKRFNGVRRITFESWQACVGLGWKKK
jgi:hypothetical protein